MKKLSIIILLTGIACHLQAQNVKLKGIVKKPLDSIISFKRTSLAAVSLEEDSKTYTAKLDAKGRFFIDLPELAIGEWAITQGDEEVYTYFRTGQIADLTIDFDADNPVKAKGKFADEINYYAFEENETYQYTTSNKEILSKDIATIAGDLKAKTAVANFQQAVLDRYRKTHQISDDFYQWIKTYYKYYPAEEMQIEKYASISGNSIADLMIDGFNDDYASLSSPTYLALVENFARYKFNGVDSQMNILDYMDYVLKSDEFKGKTKDALIANMLIRLSSSAHERPWYNGYVSKIKDASLLSMIDAKRKYYGQFLNEAKYSKEDVATAKDLREIFDRYKGKVIYLDFWASWCGPCKEEMPNSAKLKARLKNKDVVFLYFGYNDKRENWLAARKELAVDGEHYLLSPELIAEANELFKVKGIPHYVIINKDGSFVSKYANRPSAVYDELIDLVESK